VWGCKKPDKDVTIPVGISHAIYGPVAPLKIQLPWVDFCSNHTDTVHSELARRGIELLLHDSLVVLVYQLHCEGRLLTYPRQCL
jgi:hypothetical protein